MEIKWIKISTHMFDDEKIRIIEKMPEGDTILIIWIKLVVLAGKKNERGEISLAKDIPYTEDMLSTVFDRSLQVVKLALTTFQRFGMIEVDDLNFIKIKNWEKHQNVEGMEKARLQATQRQQKRREKQRLIEEGVDPKKADEMARETVYGDNNAKSLGDGNVVSRDSHSIDIDRDIDRDKEKDLKDIIINNDTQLVPNVFQLYQENIGIYSSIVAEQLGNWIDDLSEDIVKEAISITAMQSYEKHNFAYVNRILTDWKKRNFDSIEKIRAAQMERDKLMEAEQKKKRSGNVKPYYGKNGRKEVEPDWLEGHKAERDEQTGVKPEKGEVHPDEVLELQKWIKENSKMKKGDE